jgi:hypothetical protein
MSLNVKTALGLKRINGVYIKTTTPEPPADGKTRLYISLAEGRLSPVLGLGVNGSVDVDWGDGTEHGTLTGSSTSTLVTIPHTYAHGGDYVIALTAAEDTEIAVLGAAQGSLLLTKGGTATNEGQAYRASLKRAILGDSITSIGKYAFVSCYSLTNITIPNSVINIDIQAFFRCYNLTNITIPNNITSISDGMFYQCYSLTGITIPNSVTSIAVNVFEDCQNLTSITIPSSVTSIENYVFYNCWGLAFIKFESTTPPAVEGSTAFYDVPADCIIYVPQGTLEAYTSATNYPDPSTYTYVEY